MPVMDLGPTEGDVRRQIEADYAEASRAQGDWPIRHQERYRRYLGDETLRPAGPWKDDKTRLFMGDTGEVLERLQAEIVSTLWGSPEMLTAEPFGDEDVEVADLVTRYMRWALQSVQSYSERFNTAVFDLLCDSAGVYKIYPYKPPWQPPPNTDRSRYLSETINIDTIDQAYLLTPPDASGLQYPECRYLLHEFWLRQDDILGMVDQGEFSHWGGELPPYLSLHGQARPITERERTQMEREGHTAPTEPGNWYHYLEYYGRIAPGPKQREVDVIIGYWPEADERYRLSRTIPLQDAFPTRSRPMRPYFELCAWLQPRQWRGRNVPDRLKSPQDVVNRLYEDLIRYNQLNMLPFYFYNAMGAPDLPNLWEVQPGTGIPVLDMNALQFVPRPSLARQFGEMIGMAHLETERNGTVNSFNQGRSADRPNNPRTLGATSLFLQESQKSFGHISRQIALQKQKALQFDLELWQARMPPGTWARVKRPAGMPATAQSPFQPPAEQPTFMDRLFANTMPQPPMLAQQLNSQDLAGIFDVTLTINPDAQFQKQVALALAQALDPLLVNYPLGRREMWSQIWKLHGQHNFDRIWPEEVAQLQTQIVVAQAQLQLAAANMQLAAATMQATPSPPEPTQASESASSAAPEPTADDVMAMLGAVMNGGGAM